MWQSLLYYIVILYIRLMIAGNVLNDCCRLVLLRIVDCYREVCCVCLRLWSMPGAQGL